MFMTVKNLEQKNHVTLIYSLPYSLFSLLILSKKNSLSVYGGAVTHFNPITPPF